MKLVLRGEKYDLLEAVGEASMQTLKVLNVSSSNSGGHKFDPVTPRTIQECFTRLAGQFEGIEPDDYADAGLRLLDDPVFLANMQGVVFLARRKRGDQISFDEAGDFSFNEISFTPDDDTTPDGDEQEATDPKD
jgi:hypothetical protein